jgi:hypothetical protein
MAILFTLRSAERGGSLSGFRAERTVFYEYESNCCSPADLTVAGCTRIELLMVSEWSADRNLPLLTVQAHGECDGYILADQECCDQQRCYACSEACEWFPHFSRGGEAMKLRLPTNFERQV